MTIDIERVRAETPGVATVAHFNNAGAALPTQAVLDTVIDFLRLEAKIGGYEAAAATEELHAAIYDEAAALLNARVENLAITESATRAWTSALSAIPLTAGDRIITTRSEYVSNMGGLLYARDRFGAEIVLAPNDETGQVDVSALADLIDERTKVVSLSHIPTQGGLVNPAAAVGAIVADTDALFLLDACQSVGQLPIDVEEIGCDILSFTGRKFVRGPRGTGMLWVNDAALEQMGAPVGLDGGGGTWSSPFVFDPLPSARRFELFEGAQAAIMGLGAALRYINELGIGNIQARNDHLSTTLRSALAAIPGVALHDLGETQCAIVTFDVEGHDCLDVKQVLIAQGINVSVTQISSAQLDFPERGLTRLVRASLHYYNDEAEIDRLVDAVAGL